MPSSTRTTRTTQPRSDKPKVALNLDKLTREAAPEPFVAAIDGKPYTFSDPMETDWQELVVINPQDTLLYLRALLGKQYEAFTEHRMPFWKLRDLVAAVNEYYGMNPGNAGASPTS